MSGIYFHIPFCRHACHYCDFHFSTSLKTYDEVLRAMREELIYWSGQWKEPVQTIYFGGGTPSVLEDEDLRLLLSDVRLLFEVSPEAEITLEANPEDISRGKLEHWKQVGVNRLSIGVQSFFEDELKWMNRVHSADQSKRSVRLAQEVGFDNITIDLIYGLPISSNQRWAENVSQALELDVPHISAYALTVEDRTALAHQVASGKTKAPDEDTAHQQFLFLRESLISAGFDPYEISNFGKPGWHSRHNGNYWEGVPYLGIGPGAHSFDGQERRWNVAHNRKYSQGVLARESWYESEQLSVRDRYNEYLMTGLRRMNGVSLDEVASRFGDSYRKHLLEESDELVQKGWLTWSDNRLSVTESGLFFADGIAATLFDA